jgi:hypothetical protein
VCNLPWGFLVNIFFLYRFLNLKSPESLSRVDHAFDAVCAAKIHAPLFASICNFVAYHDLKIDGALTYKLKTQYYFI